MYTQVEKPKENISKSATNTVEQKENFGQANSGFMDNRVETVAQRKLQYIMDNSTKESHGGQLQGTINSFATKQDHTIQNKRDNGASDIQPVRTSVNLISPGLGMKSSYLGNKTPSLKKATTTKVGVANDIKGRDPVAIKGGDYGLTWPQEVRLVIGAKKVGDNWEPVLKEVIGRYSKQASLLLGQTDVTSEAQATTAIEASQILTAFSQFGEGAHLWYSLAAVEAHESIHARSIMTALPLIEGDIKSLIEDQTVPISGAVDEGTAITQIEALGTYDAKVEAAYDLWFAKVIALIGDDHASGGACELAELSVTNPIKEKIKTKQIDQRWLARAPMVDLLA